MAYLVITVSVPDQSIATLNEKVNKATKPHQALQGVINILEGVESRNFRSDNCYAVVRDSDPSVSTSGSGSTSTTIDRA